MASRYFCHQCQQSVGLQDTDMLCGQCGSDFIEQMQGGRVFADAFRPPIGNQGPIRPRVARIPATGMNFHVPHRRRGTPPPAPAGAQLGSLADAGPVQGTLIDRLQGLISNHLRFPRRPAAPPANQGRNGNDGPQQGPSGANQQPPQQNNESRQQERPQQQQPQAGQGGAQNQPLGPREQQTVDEFLRMLNNIFTGVNNQGNVHFQIHIGGADGAEQVHGNFGDYVWGGNMDRIVNDLMNQIDANHQVSHLSDEELDRIPMTNVNQKHVDNQTQCSTCFETFTLDEPVAQLNCEHIFHRDCVVPWLRQHKTCPMCRNEVDASQWEGDASQQRTAAENNAPPGAPAGMVDQDELD